MANTVTIGRLTFTSPRTLSFSGATDTINRTVSLQGKLAVDDLDDAKSLRDELISMSKLNVPVAFTYTGDATLKGYCNLTSASVDISRYSIGGITYSLELDWLGKPGEVNLESHFSGALIENSHSITSTTNQMHSPPRQHYTYYHTVSKSNNNCKNRK